MTSLKIVQFSPTDFADAIQRVVESKRDLATPQGVEPVLQGARHPGGKKATDFITLTVRPGEQPGRATRMNSMYSPPSQDEADEVKMIELLQNLHRFNPSR